MKTSNDVSTHDVLRTARRAQWMAGIALALLVIGFATVQINIWFQMEFYKVMSLRVSQHKNGDLQLWGKDLGYVVTHFETSDNKYATLNPPLFVTSMEYYRRQIVRLDWRDEDGKKTAPPKANEKLTAIYFRPERATPRPEK